MPTNRSSRRILPRRDRPRSRARRSPRDTGLVRRAEVRELGEQVLVGAYVISRLLSICEEGNEEIHNVVGELPAIVRVGRGPSGIIKEDVRQQSCCHSRCLLLRIPARVSGSDIYEDGGEGGI